MTNLSRVPRFSLEEAQAIANEHFGIQGIASILPSERDQNFKIDADDLAFVLKVANPDTPLPRLDLENAALQIARGCQHFRSPHLIKSRANSLLVTVRDSQGLDCQVRMISFLNGQTMAASSSLTLASIRRLGMGLGELDRGLAHLNHQPAAKREFVWDLKQAPGIVRQTLQGDAMTAETHPAVTLPEFERRQELLTHFLDLHAQVESRLDKLPESVIHNDANDYNVLMSNDPLDDWLGLIDFGDLIFSRRIHELAIAAAYLVLQDLDQPDLWRERLPQLVGGYQAIVPLSETELSVLFPLLAMRLCQSVCLSAQQRQQCPDNEYLSVSEAPAWTALERLQSVKPAEVHESLSQVCQSVPVRQPETGTAAEAILVDQLIAGRQQFLSPSLSLSYRRPLHIVRGRGQYLYDDRDDTYLDCVNNVCHVGHCHPHVVAAAKAQLSQLNTNTRYLHQNLVRYAERLVATLPDPLEVCFLVNSGSEANDLALRLARTFTREHAVAVIDHAYHGHTSALIEISPYKFNGRGGSGQPDHVEVLPMPDTYRGQFQVGPAGDRSSCGANYAQQAVDQIRLAVESGKKFAALFAESILGCGGQVPLPPGYLQPVFAAIAQQGGVCIADEVQTGFGRVGTDFWAFEQQGVVPDIVTMGKPIGNGHPLAAVVTTRAIADSFANGMEYFNTFGGNPVSCAIGLAVLDVIESEQLQSHALRVGQHLIGRLRDLQRNDPRIGDVRGSGLFLGIELVRTGDERQPDSELAGAVVEAMKRRHILLSTDGPDRNVIKFKPPLVFDWGDADRLVATLQRVLEQC